MVEQTAPQEAVLRFLRIEPESKVQLLDHALRFLRTGHEPRVQPLDHVHPFRQIEPEWKREVQQERVLRFPTLIPEQRIEVNKADSEYSLLLEIANPEVKLEELQEVDLECLPVLREIRIELELKVEIIRPDPPIEQARCKESKVRTIVLVM